MRTVASRLPLWCGLIAGGLLTGYIIAFTAAEQIWGRPSSTSGLGFFVAPFWGASAGVLGALVGLVIRAIFAIRPSAARRPRWRRLPWY